MHYTKSIFITNNGLSDHIGVAQVMPYLEGLAERGHRMECISVENPARSNTFDQGLDARIRRAGIGHHRLQRSALVWHWVDRLLIPHRLASLLDTRIALFQPDVIHCRSYMPLGAVLRAKAQHGTPFIFDMRGFWLDQRLESGIWDEGNFFWRRVIKRFRSLEQAALEQADSIVVLTEDAKQAVLTKSAYHGAPIDVIPCSVNQSVFDIRSATREKNRADLGIGPDDLVLAYLGSAGPIYRTDAVYRLYQALKDSGRAVKILFLGTHDPHDHLERAEGVKVELALKDIMCKRVAHEVVPDLLNVADFGLSFQIQSFSSLGVSATKVGEYLSCGLPVISNDGVGDIRQIIQNGCNGMVMKNFSDESIRQCAHIMQKSAFLPREEIRSSASKYFDINRAIAKYDAIYQRFSAVRPGSA